MQAQTDTARYGEGLGRFHDLLYPFVDLPEAVAYVNSVVPPPARVLDLGAGTGRLATALATRGHHVDAVDISAAMLDQLRARDVSGRVGRHVADMTEVDLGTEFDLCMVTNNTLFMLLDQERQMAALERAAAHLSPGGRLLLEVYDPGFYHQLSPQGHTQSGVLADGTLLVDAMTCDPVRQQVFVLRTLVSDGKVRTYPEVSRYAWPAELSLMARCAGLVKLECWGDWGRTPCTSVSSRHIALFRKDN